MEEEGYRFIEKIVNDRDLTSDEKKEKLEKSIYTRTTFYQYIVDNLYSQPDEDANHKIFYIKVNDDTKGIRPANLNRISRENYIDMILDRNIEIDITIDPKDCSFLELLTKSDHEGIIEFSNPNPIYKNDMKLLLERKESMSSLDFIRSKPYTIANVRELSKYINPDINIENRKSMKFYCERSGIPYFVYGYKIDIILFARYKGFNNTDRSSVYDSCEFLKIPSFPGTIFKACKKTQEEADKYNIEVVKIRDQLKKVIKTLTRTKLVKAKILNLFIPTLSPSPQNYWSNERLDKLLEKYNL